MAPEALRRRLAHGNVYGRREGRRRPRQLLPARQPVGAARAGPAVGGRPRRRRAAGLPRAPRHHPAVGDPRAGRRRPRRRARRRPPRPAGGPHRPAGQGRAHRRARRRRHRPRRRVGTSGRPTAMAAQRQLLEELGGEYRRVTSNDVAAALVDAGPGGERHPDRARRERPVAVAGAVRRLGHQPRRAAVGADRRARHLPAGRRRRTDGERRRLPRVEPVLTPLSPRRQLWGWVLAVVGLPLITLAVRQRSATRSG